MHHQAGVNFENYTEVKFRDILLTGTYGRTNLNQNLKPKSIFRFIRESHLLFLLFTKSTARGLAPPWGPGATLGLITTPGYRVKLIKIKVLVTSQ